MGRGNERSERSNSMNNVAALMRLNVSRATASLRTRGRPGSVEAAEGAYGDSASSMFNAVDPYIAGLVRGYRRKQKKKANMPCICSSDSCDGCAYAKLSALLHRGPHRECYRRFMVRHLPWNVLRRAIRRKRKVSGSTGAVPGQPRKEVVHNAYVNAPTPI